MEENEGKSADELASEERDGEKWKEREINRKERKNREAMGRK